MELQRFDIAVLGGGPGGYPAAIRAAQLGKSVALIEARELGGTCLNRGCIPSKALIAGAACLGDLKRASEFGIDASIAFDYARLAAHKNRVVERMRNGLEGLVAANKIALFRGIGRVTSRDELRIVGRDTAVISAKSLIVATGSEPRSIAAWPFDRERIHDSTSLLSLTTLPQHLIIIGGGIIGCEFASLYAKLGTQVTMIELLPRLLSSEIPEASQALKRALIRRGAQILTGVKVEEVKRTDATVTVQLEGGEQVQGDHCLIAVGRKLNTSDIGLERLGVALHPDGMVIVDEHMETTTKGIYAVGDIASKWWLAHVASHQGIIAAEHACGLSHARMQYTAIPSVIFTDPEIASVGLSLEEALKRGHRAKIGQFPFQALGKSQALLRTEGFAQIVVDELTGRILGAQVVGYDAATLISEITVAMIHELTVECIADSIHAHPTLSEVWGEASLLALERPLHFPPRLSRTASPSSSVS